MKKTTTKKAPVESEIASIAKKINGYRRKYKLPALSAEQKEQLAKNLKQHRAGRKSLIKLNVFLLELMNLRLDQILK